jgi:hypothetical protein
MSFRGVKNRESIALVLFMFAPIVTVYNIFLLQ